MLQAIHSLTTRLQYKYSGNMNDTQPPSKKSLILLVLLVLAVIGIVFYSHRGTHGVIQPQVVETTPIASPDQWPSAKVSEENENDSKSYYTIAAAYPVANDAVITGYFKSFVESSIAQFKDDTSWAAGNGANDAPAEAASLSLTITYTEQKSSNADNYVFATTTYTGGAHDLQTTKTFSFSPTGQQITLSALFNNGIAGLKTIMPYVRAQLATNPETNATMINEGTTPTEDNYQNFTVQSDSVTFIFDPYQVAPYSAGAQSVKVPLSVFKSIANKDLFK